MSCLMSLQKDFTDMTVDVAVNGKDAFDKAIESSYDLIIMDVEMPVMDGLEATRKILQGKPGTRICLLTSRAGADDFKEGRDAGCRNYLLKPVNPVDLKALLRIVHLRKSLT